MTEGFYDHLREHAVPLNEDAIRTLRDSATALDLYTWLAYRLPRINPKRSATISWQQLAVHFGNDGKNIRKFRQTVRDAWDRHVSAVYPEARAEFDTTLVRLHASPAPLQQKLVQGARLTLVADENSTPEQAEAAPKAVGCEEPAKRLLQALNEGLGPAEARAWLKEASAEFCDGEWVLWTSTRFTAHWINTRLDLVLRRAAESANISGKIVVRARPSST